MKEKGEALMELKYLVDGMGIYIEYDNKNKNGKWNKSIEKDLKNQLYDLQIAEGIDNEAKIKQKLVFKNYSLLDIESLKDGRIVPESSIYKDGLFVSLDWKIAFKIEKDTMFFWVHEDPWLSIPFILQFLFKQRNITFVHGAGITIDNKGILLPAFYGMGKTSFIAEAVKDKRVKILGDDLILLDSDGYLHPYPRPFYLYSHHKTLFPEYFKKNKVIYKNPTLWNRGIRKIKSILNIPDYTIFDSKVAPPSQLLDKSKIADKKAPIDKIYLLRRYKGLENLRVGKTEEIDKIVNFCAAVTFHESYPPEKFIFHLLGQEEGSVSAYYKSIEDIIRKCISEANNMYIVGIPENMSDNEIARELGRVILKES